MVLTLFYTHISYEVLFIINCWQYLENKELQEKVFLLQQQLNSVMGNKPQLPADQLVSEEYVEELRKKTQCQVITGFCSHHLDVYV